MKKVIPALILSITLLGASFSLHAQGNKSVILADDGKSTVVKMTYMDDARTIATFDLCKPDNNPYPNLNDNCVNLGTKEGGYSINQVKSALKLVGKAHANDVLGNAAKLNETIFGGSLVAYLILGAVDAAPKIVKAAGWATVISFLSAAFVEGFPKEYVESFFSEDIDALAFNMSKSPMKLGRTLSNALQTIEN